MKTRRCVYFLSALLIVGMLCGLLPAAYADYGTCPNGVCNMGRGCPCGCGDPFMTEEAVQAPSAVPAEPLTAAETEAAPTAEDELQAERLNALTNFMLYTATAQQERDPAVQRELDMEAQRIWNDYMDMVLARTMPEAALSEEPLIVEDDLQSERLNALTNFMLYTAAAEQETDPAIRRELDSEAQRIWNEYMDMVLAQNVPEAAPSVEDVLQSERIGVLHDFLLYTAAAEQETDPAVQAAILSEAKLLWDEYVDMLVSRSDDADTPAVPVQDAYLEAEPQKAETAEAQGKEEPWCAYNDQMTDMLLNAIFGIQPTAQPTAAEQSAETTAAPAETAAVPETTVTAAAEDQSPFFGEFFWGSVLPESMNQSFIGLPNPWTQTPWLDEAIAISGVDANPPQGASLPQHVEFSVYRAVPGTFEADYSNGTDKLTLRASVEDEGFVLSGDYNKYSKAWTEDINGIMVDCLGDGERINVATFKNGGVAYSLTMACGEEGKGLTVEELKELVSGLFPNFSAEPQEQEPAPALSADSVVTFTDLYLTTLDPKLVDENGQPLRMVRRAETNLGDLWADAYRIQGGADIGLVNSGGLLGGFGSGLVTQDDIYNTSPFGDTLCVAEVSGQQILDGLEWACRMLPEDSGSFLQVSGLTFEVHSYLPSPCLVDMDGNYAALRGERRVKNVLVGGEPLVPEKTYRVAASDYILLSGEDGNTAFQNTKLLKTDEKSDIQLMVDYLIDDCGGEIGQEYADPCGQGRIVIVDTEPQPESEQNTAQRGYADMSGFNRQMNRMAKFHKNK